MLVEFKFTPGPWKVYRGVKGWLLKCKQGCVLGGINRFPPSTERGAEQEANARLVEAAPELAKFCARVIDEGIALEATRQEGNRLLSRLING